MGGGGGRCTSNVPNTSTCSSVALTAARAAFVSSLSLNSATLGPGSTLHPRFQHRHHNPTTIATQNSKHSVLLNARHPLLPRKRTDLAQGIHNTESVALAAAVVARWFTASAMGQRHVELEPITTNPQALHPPPPRMLSTSCHAMRWWWGGTLMCDRLPSDGSSTCSTVRLVVCIGVCVCVVRLCCRVCWPGQATSWRCRSSWCCPRVQTPSDRRCRWGARCTTTSRYGMARPAVSLHGL